MPIQMLFADEITQEDMKGFGLVDNCTADVDYVLICEPSMACESLTDKLWPFVRNLGQWVTHYYGIAKYKGEDKFIVVVWH
jgi:hypothetical protein